MHNGGTSLMNASAFGQLHVMEWLVVVLGVDINGTNRHGLTALDRAVARGARQQLKAVQWLRAHGGVSRA